MCKFLRIGLIIPIILFVAAGCEKTTDVEHAKRALEFENKGDLRSAIIEYKSALKLNDTPQIRYALGSIYAHIGDVDGAEKELGIAIGQGYQVSDAKVLLARVFVLAHAYQKLLDKVSIDDALDNESKAKLYVYRGLAHLGLGDKQSALTAISQAQELAEELPEVLYGRAYLAFMNNDLDNATMTLQRVIELSPDYQEARLLLADIAFSRSKIADAEALYRQVISSEPEKVLTAYSLRANLGLIQALISDKDISAAKERVEYLKKKAPDNPMVFYFEGVIFHHEKKLAEAEDQLLKVLNMVPGHKPSLLLLGAINYEQGEYQQAEEYLSKYVNADPTHTPARKLLAATRMRLHQPESAMDALEPLLEQAGEDVSTLIMAGSAAVRSGELNVGTAYLKKAVSADPENAAARTELAMAYVAESDYSKAIKELEQASSQSDNAAKKANLLLVLTHMKNGDEKAALDAAKKYLDKYPEEPVSHNLLGIIYQQTGKEDAAVESFEKALSLDNRYTPAAINLARMAMSQGKLKEAQERYQSILVHDDSNVAVMLALAQISQKLGNEEQAIKWLKEAVDRSSQALAPRLLMAQHYLRDNDISGAKKYLSEAMQIAPDAPEVLVVQGMVEMAQGNVDQALDAYDRLLEIDSQSIVGLYQTGLIYSVKGQYELARKALKEALKVDPDHLPSAGLLARLDIKEGRFKESERLVDRVVSSQPDSYAAYILEADLFYARKNFSRAIELYNKAAQIRPGETLVLRIAKAYRLSGKKEEAYKTLRDWIKQHPDSYRVGLALAGELERRGDRDQAITTYETLLSYHADDPIILNNLAWAYSERNDDKALEYAEKAYKAAPENPYVLDTYGWVLVKNGEADKAVRLLRQAMKINPDIADVQYHLAMALVKTGKTSEARKILENLLESPEGLSVSVDEIKKVIEGL